MSAVSITCWRTVSRLRNLLPTAFITAIFLSASAGLFSFALSSAEGTHQLLSVVWAASVAPFLPVLAAFLAMDAWSEEKRTGRDEILLSTAIKERDLVFGKFLGISFTVGVAILLSLGLTLVMAAWSSSSILAGVRTTTFLPALFILFLQGALWSAIALALGTFFRHGFVAASMTVGALVALPRGLWMAAMLYSPAGRTAYGEMPLDAHVVDFASGVFSTGVIALYPLFTAAALIIATQSIVSSRFRGRGAVLARVSSRLVMAISLIAAISVAWLALRLDITLDFPVGETSALSPRMRQILTDSSGRVVVSAFVARKDPAFRPLAHFLRTLERRSKAVGGLEIVLKFVDPNWDVGAANHLVHLGAKESTIVFEKGPRVSMLPLSEGYGDGLVSSAIRRVALPPQRQDVYWTVGHGEASVNKDSEDTYHRIRGMSDIARELSRNGYRNKELDLGVDQSIPAECALIVVAGAKTAFSRAELNRLDTYLKSGGRLLVMMGSEGEETGVAPLLPAWGIRPLREPLMGAKTMSGSDVIVSDFAEHRLTAGLEGSRLVFERPFTFVPSAASETGKGADKLAFTPIANVSRAAVVAAVERGGNMGSDLGVRPTRIVVVGDSTFVLNGNLATRANANRDFFMNIISYLSGTEIVGLSGSTSSLLISGLDRAARARHAIISTVVFPCGVLIAMLIVIWRRRSRS